MIQKRAVPRYGLVMIIDDTYVDMYITSRVVTKLNLGSRVLQFSTAGEALAYLSANADTPEALPGLIFVDIYMPGMSGFEFMDAYSNLPSSVQKRCKVFIISSTFDQGDISRARSYPNVVDFVEKPLGKEILDKV